MRRSFLLSSCALILSTFMVGMTPAFSQEYTVPQDQEPTIIPNEFIVTFKQPQGFISGELVFEGVEIQLQSLQTHTGTNQVFLVKTDENNLSVILSDSRIQSVEPNMLFHITGISNGMPFGVDRIEADLRANHGDGIDDALDVDIAVMDTGCNPNNQDMRIVTCIGFDGGSGIDTQGHGSHVQGTIGAIDNADSIVGVAEGARIHSLLVCPPGGCPTSKLIQAADWTVAEKDPDGKQTIEVVNMSLGGVQPTNNTSCSGNVTAWQAALCRVYNAGIIIVVAAGNSNQDSTNTFVPCAWDSTICVSSMQETDGKAGGLGPSIPFGQDDTMSGFSNFGQVIDLIAPGCQVLSYNQFGVPWKICGTSMASPHVAGAAALATLDFLNPTDAAGVEEVRQFLINEGFPRDSPDGWTGDKDNFAEPLVQVAFGQTPPPPDTHDMVMTAFTADPTTVIQGDIVDLQATIFNAGSVFEDNTSIRYRDTLTRTGIASQFQIDISAGQTIVGDMKQWDTTGAILGDHVLRAKVTLNAVDENPFDNDMFVLVTVLEPLDLPAQVAKNTADINVLKEIHGIQATILDEDGGVQIWIIITITIGWITITISILVTRRKG